MWFISRCGKSPRSTLYSWFFVDCCSLSHESVTPERKVYSHSSYSAIYRKCVNRILPSIEAVHSVTSVLHVCIFIQGPLIRIPCTLWKCRMATDSRPSAPLVRFILNQHVHISHILFFVTVFIQFCMGFYSHVAYFSLSLHVLVNNKTRMNNLFALLLHRASWRFTNY